MSDRDNVLHIGDDDRYSRLKMIGWWDQSRLTRARVLVVGAGALGNEVIKNLALVGIGQVAIVDFDAIETSNLTRSVLFRASDCGRNKADVAAGRAMELNPDCRMISLPVDMTMEVGLGVIERADVVICCVDNREARLWINRMCWRVGVPWIDGGIQEINGVAKTFVPPNGACYECAMTENDYRLLQLRYSCPLLPREDILAGRVPTAPTIASLIGALQTQEALKLLHGRPVGEGMALVFNGDANRFYATRYPRRENCLSHESYSDIVNSDLSAERSTLGELYDFARKSFGESVECLELDRDFLLNFVCENCQTSTVVNRPVAHFTVKDSQCPDCGQDRWPELTAQLQFPEAFSTTTLRQLGIPAFDIVKIRSANQSHFIRLGGDGGHVWSEDEPQ